DIRASRPSAKISPRSAMAWEAIMAQPWGSADQVGTTGLKQIASQSALEMTNTGASSLATVQEPPAHTSTLQRNRAVAAIRRTIPRIAPSQVRYGRVIRFHWPDL